VSTEKLRVLMELRPALEGYSGIPQETRLLFRELSAAPCVELEGLLVPSVRKLARGATDSELQPLAALPRKINRYSRIVVSLSAKPYRAPLDAMADFVTRRVRTAVLSLMTLFRVARLTLRHFESRGFEDFIWRTLFAKTLPASDFDLVTAKNLRVCSVTWENQQRAGLFTLLFHRYPRYPRLDTRDFDVVIAQMPYPGRVAPATTLVVRYHDAIPIFMPHTIPDTSKHQAFHFYALLGNVRTGAYFACASDATRASLLRVFPEAAERAVTIHDMVSPHYFREESSPERIPQIIRNHLNRTSELIGPEFLSVRESESFYRRVLAPTPFRYLLTVGTIEPRKSHMRLRAAWDLIRAEGHGDLKLLVVGALGWDCEPILRDLRAAVDQGNAFLLSGVPASDLRVLYRHALVTVCPSLGEGFDYPGVEAMRSGGLVAASDIPVHREIYTDAAEYFDPYSTADLADTLRHLLSPNGAQFREELRNRGQAVSARYVPECIMPQWQAFLSGLMQGRRSP
jgi:glycosyltransferase involved in cell wall biosynthesis